MSGDAKETAGDPLEEWSFELPEALIARHPAAQRDGSRLLVLPRSGGGPHHRNFRDVRELLRPGDLLVGNNTRVMAARLRAKRATGGIVELLVLDPSCDPVPALARPLRRLKHDEVLELAGGGRVRLVREGAPAGQVCLDFLDASVVEVMAAQGAMPLPPYMERPATADDRGRYQTVYAGPLGAAAAPTAGLHFTEALLGDLKDHGVGFETVTLHVGIGTFRPLQVADLDRGRLHHETYILSDATASAIAETRAAGGRVVAIGTTSTRVLESCTPAGHRIPVAGAGSTDLFIRPGYDWRCVDALITNFHLPRSSLLMLVAALVGRSRLLAAYEEAIGAGYRFYSYGDAMFIS